MNRLITTTEAAELLRVSPRTVLKWIEHDAIPYVALPQIGESRRDYRIPLHGLLNSLSGNYSLADQLDAFAQASGKLGVTEAEAAARGPVAAG
jgi:excisionase family DNA binding protein